MRLMPICVSAAVAFAAVAGTPAATATTTTRAAAIGTTTATATGTAAVTGTTAVTAIGTTTATATPPLNNGVALTPPMGWNSWNSLGTAVTEAQVVQTIDFMSGNGMVAAGYNTVTIDDGWSLNHRSGQSADPVKTSYGSLQLYDAGGNPVSGSDGTGNDPTSGDLQPNSDFPPQTVNGQTLNGIAYLAWYAHSKGMKFGLYTTDTYLTCQGHPGSLGHEATDAADFVSWGVDYVKDDNCPNWSGPHIIGPDGHDYGPQGEGKELTESIYARIQTFQKALDAASAAQGRPKVVVSVSAQPPHTGVPYLESPDDPARSDSVIAAAGTPQYDAPGYAPTGVWCGQVANLCRIGGDRDSELAGVLYGGQLGTALQYAANVRPGSWNDMDMMYAGWNDPDGLWGVTDTCTCHKPFTDTESQTEISILSMMAAPLITGADLRTAADSQHSADGYTWSTGISTSALALYENPDVVGVDQDALGVPATLVGSPPTSATGPVVLRRTMADGDTVVLLVNQDPDNAQQITTTPSALGLPAGSYHYADLWTKATGTLAATGTLGGSVAAHGVEMFRISSAASAVSPVVGDGRYHDLAASGTNGSALEVAGQCGAPGGGPLDVAAYQPTYWSQWWQFSPNADGTVRIYDGCYSSTQQHGTLTASGSAVTVLNAYDPTDPAQKWRLTTESPGGGLSISNVATGNVLGVSGSTVVADSGDPTLWTPIS
ncbi:alpha-galactosidase [Catenulispora pinisilvae]|uniref:alpha-galactosidase n=1 Tax=Catenulispora pinisilvae TaxID=2705253 RepID=UPI0018911E83|nr:alpha-galactosidase [Catenulispora pinisilvae]